MSERLGRGLDAIFGEDYDIGNFEEKIVETERPIEIKIDNISPNPYQPRKHFNEEALKELASSIKEHGIFSPLILNKHRDGKYILIAGERRLRAAKLVGLETVPSIICELNNKQMSEIALLENIQREDLNAIEEAQAYSKLIKEYNYTQLVLAERVHKSREYVANILRLNKLPEIVQDNVIKGTISVGHARCLLTIHEDLIEEIMNQIIAYKLNVRDTEKLCKGYNKKKKIKKKDTVHFDKQINELSKYLNKPIKINKNTISIPFKSEKELAELIEKITKKDV